MMEPRLAPHTSAKNAQIIWNNLRKWRQMMTNPFDYIASISTNKKNMMRDSENDTLAEKQYNAWIVNKGLSYFQDTVLHANLMNINHHLGNRPQYEFLLNSIRPSKRYAKWVKDEGDEDLDAICSAYACNKTVGREYLSLLSSEQISAIKKQQEIGGTKK
jgi:hypothetical protein